MKTTDLGHMIKQVGSQIMLLLLRAYDVSGVVLNLTCLNTFNPSRALEVGVILIV